MEKKTDTVKLLDISTLKIVAVQEEETSHNGNSAGDPPTPMARLLLYKRPRPHCLAKPRMGH